MHSDESETAWLFCEGTDEQRELSGNRAGFEQLHSAIGDLLGGDAGQICFPDPSIGFSALELHEKPPLHEPSSRPATAGEILLFAILLSIPLFALFGFYQFIRLLFS